MSYSILIVDDHVLLRKGIRSILEKIHDVDFVEEANDGFDAIEIARKHTFDVVLLDISMPGKDGRDVCMELKSSPETQDVKIIMFTGRDSHHDRILALKLGADEYVEKPCQFFYLERAVDGVLRNM